MAKIKYVKHVNEENKIVVEFESNPDTVTISRYWQGYMSISYSNHVTLTEKEAARLYEILKEHFDV